MGNQLNNKEMKKLRMWELEENTIKELKTQFMNWQSVSCDYHVNHKMVELLLIKEVVV